MKVKFFAVLAALLMVGAVAIPASAQELTNDVIFLRVGYIPNYTVGYEPADNEDDEYVGWTGMAEYNLNLSPVLLGFGIEYQRLVDDADAVDDEDAVVEFLIPQVTAKFMTAGGFYIGAGLAGKYLIGYDFGKSGGVAIETDKTVDLWANAVIGYMATISDGIYLDISGRFGYNLTNNTFDEATVGTTTVELKADSAYDIAIYVGIGFKSFGTGL